MPKAPLLQPTKRQAEVLAFIASYTQAHGYSPTVREIGESCGITSTNGVMCHLRALVKKGVLRQARRGGRVIARTLEVVGDAAMAEAAPDVEQIVSAVTRKFRCLHLDKPPVFASGIDVGEVVRFVLAKGRT